jgi:hypothetical protein
VSVACFIGQIKIAHGTWSASLCPQNAFEFHSCTENPERIGLAELVSLITAHPDVSGRIVIYSDSALGAIPEINARKVSILGDLYCPENFTIAYAAGDRGTEEFVGNRSIAFCDRISSDFLDEIAANKYPSDYFIRAAAPFTKYRYLRAPDVRGWGRTTMR